MTDQTQKWTREEHLEHIAEWMNAQTNQLRFEAIIRAITFAGPQTNRSLAVALETDTKDASRLTYSMCRAGLLWSRPDERHPTRRRFDLTLAARSTIDGVLRWEPLESESTSEGARP